MGQNEFNELAAWARSMHGEMTQDDRLGLSRGLALYAESHGLQPDRLYYDE